VDQLDDEDHIVVQGKIAPRGVIEPGFLNCQGQSSKLVKQ
jgi:hypothetical protein